MSLRRRVLLPDRGEGSVPEDQGKNLSQSEQEIPENKVKANMLLRRLNPKLRPYGRKKRTQPESCSLVNPDLPEGDSEECLPDPGDPGDPDPENVTIPENQNEDLENLEEAERIQTGFLKIGQLNLQYGREITYEARRIFDKHKLALFLLQEPYQVEGQVRGFGLRRLVAGNQPLDVRPMAAIIAEPTVVSTVEMLQHKTTHFTVVQIRTAIGDIHIVSAYFQWCHEIQEYLDKLDEILWSLNGKHVLFGGDVNAKSVLWHNGFTDERGEELEQLIIRHNLVIINEEGQPATHQAGNNLDVTLATRRLSKHIRKWTVHPNESISDHRFTTFELFNLPDDNQNNVTRMNVRAADFEALNETMLQRNGGYSLHHREEIKARAGKPLE